MRFLRTVFDRMSVLRTVHPQRQMVAASAAEWSRARQAAPQVIPDLIVLGGVLAMQPADYHAGIAQPAPIDPHRLSYEAGKRDLAIQLLTLMGVDSHELMTLMENNDVR